MTARRACSATQKAAGGAPRGVRHCAYGHPGRGVKLLHQLLIPLCTFIVLFLAAGPGMADTTIISQIHNAPGWLPSHVYHRAADFHARVVNGPGWNPAAASYNPGRTLAAYQLTSAGTCVSAPSGGPTGSGLSIRDGTCTWKYLSPVDYVSITGWAFDNRRWQDGTTYTYFDVVTSGSPLRAYGLADKSCRSTSAPRGTGTHGSYDGLSVVSMDDGCRWYYLADILYSSDRSFIPTVQATVQDGAATVQATARYEAQLWNDREYVAGQNGERDPIVVTGHGVPPPYSGDGTPILRCCSFHLTITAAPGESFADNMPPADPINGIDPSKGVTVVDNDGYMWPIWDPAALMLYDPNFTVTRLQLKGVHGAGIAAFNEVTVQDCIVEGGSNDEWPQHSALFLDAGPDLVANSLVISHGPIGVTFKYPGILLHDTIVSADGRGLAGVEIGNKWVFKDTIVADTAIFGFAHAGAHLETGTPFNSRSSHNVTDAPVGDSGTALWVDGKKTTTVDTIPGTTYGIPAGVAFVHWRSDLRPKPHGPLVGAGAPFGTFQAAHTTLEADTPDLIGTARPQGARYDIGAIESIGAVAVTSAAAANSGGGR
jgi:hypothetical protein